MSAFAATLDGAVPAVRARRFGAPTALGRLALGDFQERTRSSAYLVTLIVAVWCAHVFLPANGANYATLSIGTHRGVYDSAWVGALVAMMANVFLGFAGFYLVKSAVERDRRTQVGEVLAGTPLAKPLYTLSKWLSNFMVLASMMAVLTASAAVLQWVRGEDPHLAPLALVEPMLWVTLPYMALVAAMAVLFETVPVLAGGFGNAVWFVLWVAMLSTDSFGLENTRGGFDPMGLQVLLPDMIRSAIAAFPHEHITTHSVSMGFSFSDHGTPHVATFVWPGSRWSATMIGARLVWVAVALGVALTAALPFDRFERGRAPRLGARLARWSGGRRAAGDAAAERDVAPLARRGDPDALLAVLATQPVARGAALAPLVGAELRLALRGMPRAWALVAIGLVPFALLLPLDGARIGVAAVAWVWPLLVWSASGTREGRYGTAPLFAAAPRPLDRQLLAQWLAGVLVTLAFAAPLSLRLLAAGEPAAGLTGLAGALVVPAFALAAGTLTGSTRLFEAVYLCAWYAGVLNRVPALDVSGGSVRPGEWMSAAGFLLATPALLALARFGRARRLFG